jgi:hypothetical protein
MTPSQRKSSTRVSNLKATPSDIKVLSWVGIVTSAYFKRKPMVVMLIFKLTKAMLRLNLSEDIDLTGTFD